MRESRGTRRLLTALVAAAGMTAGMTFVAPPASAASATCQIAWKTSCNTGELNANSRRHDIAWSVFSLGRGCHWVVRDVASKAIVGSGDLGAFDEAGGYIGGLYGRYRMELSSCGSGNAGYISND
ncbi:hypothetical protein ACIBCT_30110 [Streptosporangium sp. NPDC050855]|uniref:hypothetical protein n=1 Tax=Streptosporangium sp. NPDC050855 TaxID=3366194 RepID=UPI0037BBA3A4